MSQIEFTQMQNGAASEGLMTASGMILREDRSMDKELGVGKQQRPAKGTKPSLWVSEQMPPYRAKPKIFKEIESGGLRKLIWP